MSDQTQLGSLTRWKHSLNSLCQQPQLRGTFLISESEATVTYGVTRVHRVTVICKRHVHKATFICAHFCFSESGVPLCPRHACSLFYCDFGSLRTTVVFPFPAWEPLERVNCPHQTGTPRGSVCLPKKFGGLGQGVSSLAAGVLLAEAVSHIRLGTLGAGLYLPH